MLQRKRISVLLLSMMLVLTSLPVTAFADSRISPAEGVLSTEAKDFLAEHGVDPIVFDVVPLTDIHSIQTDVNESILSLIRQAEANDFTDQQIQQYVEGVLSHSPDVFVDQEEAERMTAEADGIGISPNYVRPFHDDGMGFEVLSTNGWYESTAYATLPTVNKTTNNSEAYMFFTVGGSGSWGIDVGVSYQYGSGGNAWRGFYMANGSQSYGSVMNNVGAGKLLYFHGTIETNGYLRFRVLDGNNFSTVYYDLYYYVGSNNVSRSNGNFNRQITLTDNQERYTNGTSISNAKFTDSYLYSASTYSRYTAANTVSSRRGVFAPKAALESKIKANSTPWYAETVSITFGTAN